MSIAFDHKQAREQSKSKGRAPKYPGQIVDEKWVPESRYAKNEFGISSINSGMRRKDYRQSAAQTRNSKRNNDGSVTRGYRAKAKSYYKKVFLHNRKVNNNHA